MTRHHALSGLRSPRGAARHRGTLISWGLLAVAVALLAGGAAQRALADGDPASTVLLSHSYFLPEDANASAQQRKDLASLLSAAAKAGLPIRVAVIPNEFDLGGTVVELWRKPRIYAKFLAIEVSNYFKSALLVVMPNGFGVNWPGHSTTTANHLLAAIKIAPGSAGLLRATKAGVRALTSAGNIKLAAS